MPGARVEMAYRLCYDGPYSVDLTLLRYRKETSGVSPSFSGEVEMILPFASGSLGGIWYD